MDYIDYYKLLGIPKTATASDIKAAYRKLARKHHPDLNPNDKDALKKFQQINEANEVLSDATKRKKYDQYGKDWQHAEEFEQSRQQQRQSAQNQQQQYGGGQNMGDFSDFFSSMFGNMGGSGGNRPQAKYRGEDFSAEVRLQLIEAYVTHKQTLTVNDTNIRITIPAGIENGQTIKIKGHGGISTNGGPNGDLYITFALLLHPRIKRLENNLYTTVDLDLYVAMLGGEITMETLTGKVKLHVAAETQNGTKIKLKGKGFPVYKQEGQFGDFYVTYNLKTPTHLTPRQKELFTELSKTT